MITISEPMILVDKFWNTKEYHKIGVFRLMSYIMRVDYENEVYLLNIVTGQLVRLSRDETELVESLPADYSPIMDTLIKNYYIVPIEFDEHQKVVGIRELLRKMEDAKRGSAINVFTILPTTACNARFWYCFEHGIEPVSMSEQTADDVIEFIKNNSKGQKVFLRWFGGEPTVASARIDQISLGLKRNGVSFTSRMTTNGYLFDETMINRAKELWNLNSVRITLDGTEKNYNRIKSYVNSKDNPYRRVMRNIALFIENGITVELRLNFDKSNYADFYELLESLEPQYRDNHLLKFFAHQINDYTREIDENESANIESWFNDKIAEFNNLSRAKGMLSESDRLPSLNFFRCDAAKKNAITITPEGNLVNCPEKIQPELFVGSIKSGIVNEELAQSWRKAADYDKCNKCVLFPKCVRFERCSGKDKCYLLKDYLSQYHEAVIKTICNQM